MSKPIFNWNLFRAMWTTVALNPGASAASVFECDEMRDFQQKYGDAHRPIKCDYTAEAIKQYIPYASDYTSEHLREFWPINWYGDPDYPNQHMFHVYHKEIVQHNNDVTRAMRIAERIRDLPLMPNAPRLYEIDSPDVCYIIKDSNYTTRMQLGHVLLPASCYIDFQDFLPPSSSSSQQAIETARDDCHIAVYERIAEDIPCVAVGIDIHDNNLAARIESTALHNNYICATINPISTRPQYTSLTNFAEDTTKTDAE